MPNEHAGIHKLVFAIKALNHVLATATLTSDSEVNIKWAKELIWSAGDKLGIDIAGQMQKMEQTN